MVSIAEPLEIRVSAKNCCDFLFFLLHTEAELKRDGIVTTSSAGLSASTVVHIQCQDSLAGWRAKLVMCLEAAQKNKLKSLALPPLSAGNTCCHGYISAAPPTHHCLCEAERYNDAELSVLIDVTMLSVWLDVQAQICVAKQSCQPYKFVFRLVINSFCALVTNNWGCVVLGQSI